MLRPLIDRLVLLRALPTPAQPYTVVWENLFALHAEKQALVAKDVATALAVSTPGRHGGNGGPR